MFGNLNTNFVCVLKTGKLFEHNIASNTLKELSLYYIWQFPRDEKNKKKPLVKTKGFFN